jgi:predicted transcriptional regulator
MPEYTPPHFRLLGNLERAVMEHLWSTGPADAKAVHKAIGTERGITLNTVQSTLKRLEEKGVLHRRKVSHAYVYEPRVGRQTFGREVLDDVIDELMGGMKGGDGNADAVISAFVDLTERAGEDQLKRLESLVTERLKSRRQKQKS